MDTDKPLVAIIGPTASGKTELALYLAKKYGGEIVCADSRTMYKGMDIGTAKPSLEVQRAIKHHCLDLITPNQKYSVKDFQKVANRAIETIVSRGKLPILVGGSGLYTDAVLYSYDFGVTKREDSHNLDNLALKDLQKLAHKEGLKPSHQTFVNRRHLAGFIRRGGIASKKSLRPNTIILGLDVGKKNLNERIERRIEIMFKDGLIDETKTLLEKWGEDAPGFLTPGYKPVIDFLHERLTLEGAKEVFIRNDKQLAKRQITWFKRNPSIHWIASKEEAEQLIEANFRTFDTMGI